MAVHLVRRKRTLIIILSLSLVGLLFLYTRSEKIGQVNQVEENSLNKNSRDNVDLIVDRNEAELTTIPLPTKTYSVTIIDGGEDDDEEEEGEKGEKREINKEKELMVEVKKKERNEETVKEEMAGEDEEEIEEEWKKGKDDKEKDEEEQDEEEGNKANTVEEVDQVKEKEKEEIKKEVKNGRVTEREDDQTEDERKIEKKRVGVAGKRQVKVETVTVDQKKTRMVKEKKIRKRAEPGRTIDFSANKSVEDLGRNSTNVNPNGEVALYNVQINKDKQFLVLEEENPEQKKSSNYSSSLENASDEPADSIGRDIPRNDTKIEEGNGWSSRAATLNNPRLKKIQFSTRQLPRKTKKRQNVRQFQETAQKPENTQEPKTTQEPQIIPEPEATQPEAVGESERTQEVETTQALETTPKSESIQKTETAEKSEAMQKLGTTQKPQKMLRTVAARRTKRPQQFRMTQRPGIAQVVQENKKPTTAINEVPLACKIPKFDPFHPHIFRLINDVGTDLRKRCRSAHPRSPAFKIANNKLVLRSGINEEKILKQSIRIKEIHRNGDFEFSYSDAWNPFRGLKSIHESSDIGKSDFFRVNYEIDDKSVSDLLARVAPKTGILKKQLKRASYFRGKGIPLNVLIVGFDSTSRANFERKMGRVVSFLKTHFNTYFMEGMSIVGDATTPCLSALLTGKDETELPEGRRSRSAGMPIDNWPWIMKDYAKQGYMTLFAEDDPSVSSFNLRLHGFQRSPTHHYMRPFWLSLEGEGERDEPGLCSNSQSMTNLTLKYLESFFQAYPTAKKFAFGFMSYLAHAHPNHLSYAEDDLLWFLRTFVKNRYHKDTMLIIMGDHGSRNDEFRDTTQGKLEERLPWFSISLHDMFHRRFPDLAANLRNNQPIISSPFDVHATLRHVLTYPNVPSNEHTQSLFDKLPHNRTCADAGIAEHWCPCLNWKPADITTEPIRKIGLAAVKHINHELSKNTELQRSCHQLTLDTIQDAVTLEANSKLQRFRSTDQDGDRHVRFGTRTKDDRRYQVIFTTRPNNGKYEATASVSLDNSVTVNQEISRINRYNDQPACIAQKYPYARKFCYCRTSP